MEVLIYLQAAVVVMVDVQEDAWVSVAVVVYHVQEDVMVAQDHVVVTRVPILIVVIALGHVALT